MVLARELVVVVVGLQVFWRQWQWYCVMWPEKRTTGSRRKVGGSIGIGIDGSGREDGRTRSALGCCKMRADVHVYSPGIGADGKTFISKCCWKN